MGHQVGIHMNRRNAGLAGLLGLKGGLGGAGSHVCPRRPGARWGRGVGRNHTGLKFPLLARRGRRRGGPRGKGRVGGRTENSGRGLQRGGWCAPRRSLCSGRATTFSASNGPGAGRSPPPSSEVAGILTQEVSAQAQPPQRQHREPHLSPRPARTRHRCLRGGVGGRFQWDPRPKLGRWSGQREKITWEISGLPRLPGLGI